MPLPHEEAAKKIHPEAHHFFPVKKKFSSLVYGWYFQTKKVEMDHEREWSWVTADGSHVSSDSIQGYNAAGMCSANLKAFVKNRNAVLHGPRVTVSNTGNAVAGDGGRAVSGIDYGKN